MQNTVSRCMLRFTVWHSGRQPCRLLGASLAQPTAGTQQLTPQSQTTLLSHHCPRALGDSWCS